MRLLYDASAILNIIRSLGEDAIKYIKGNFILSLTPYEIGNALWKEALLLRRISVDDALSLLKDIRKIYDLLDMIMPKNQFITLKVALLMKITYYDSAYIIAAAENNLTLVTDDMELINKMKSNEDELYKLLQRKIEILTTDNLMQEI
ncbi:MAG TPA: PIN domain nuclease [Thermoprotei archaeon]|nr:PIN domain nuclease [Thermoprotei archaeon]